jgi:hypothetical protein
MSVDETLARTIKQSTHQRGKWRTNREDPKSEPEGQKSKSWSLMGKGIDFVSENVGWCRACHGTLFPLRSRHGSAAACRELAVKAVCHKRGREIGERARPTLGSTEAPYYGTFFISENAAWPTTAAAVFFSNFRTFILAAKLNFRTSELCSFWASLPSPPI